MKECCEGVLWRSVVVKSWRRVLEKSVVEKFWRDHKQTPGGIHNTTEAKMFRRKLLSRPLGLRCDTEYFQLHLLGMVVARFMVGPAGSLADRWGEECWREVL